MAPKCESKFNIKDFTWRGGELAHWICDSTLVIPPNAIPRGQTWQIGIRVHTSLGEYDDKLELSNYKGVLNTNKQFRSSAVEFQIISVVENGMNRSLEHKEFVEPVTITLNHSVSKGDMKALRVFCAEDDNTLQPIPNVVPSTNANNFDAPYFQVEGRYVIIKTKHFCSYFTCICSDTPIKKNIKAINAIVYGRMVRKERGEYPYIAQVDFGLQILLEDSVGSLPEFWESYVSRKLRKGMIELESRPIVLDQQLSFECLTDLQLSWVPDKDDEESCDWIIDDRFDRHPKELKNVFPCERQQYTPIETTFLLKGKHGFLNAGIQLTFKQKNNVYRELVNFCLELFLNSEHKRKQAGSRLDKLEVNYQQGENNQQGDSNQQRKLSPDLEDVEGFTFPVFEVERDTGRALLSRQNLRQITEHIAPAKFIPLGLTLGFTYSQIEQFRHDNEFRGIRFICDMLNIWCTQQVDTEGQSIDATVELLAAKLRGIDCLGASYIVQGLPHERIDLRDLYTLAENIPFGRYDFLGLKLCFSRTDLEYIRESKPNNTVGAVYEMLECWSDREVGDNSLDVRVNTLIEALRAVGLADIAERLTDYATSRKLKQKTEKQSSDSSSLFSTRCSDPEKKILSVRLSEVEEMSNKCCTQPLESTEYTSEKFRGTFKNAGGTLETYFTDDHLIIPQGAIPEGESYDIWGVVHASLDRHTVGVDRESGERLIAPVNEFCVEGNKHFLIPIQVVVHHGARLEELNKVNVALREDNGEIIPVLPELQKVEGKPWFKIDEQVIVIHSRQLCEIVCKYCSKVHNGILRGTLYGQVFERDGLHYAQFEFYMQYCRGCIHNLTSMKESRADYRAAEGFAYIDSRPFDELPDVDVISPDDKLLVDFLFIVGAEEWKLCANGGNELTEEFVFGSKLPCLKSFDDPKRVAHYLLQSTSSKPTFPMLIKQRARILKETSTYGELVLLQPFGDKKIFDAQLQRTTVIASGLTDNKLYKIAQNIHPKSWYGVGIMLGLPASTLDVIEEDKPESVTRKTFIMLRTWRMQLTTDVTKAEEKLKSVLTPEAIRILEDATNNEDVYSTVVEVEAAAQQS